MSAFILALAVGVASATIISPASVGVISNSGATTTSTFTTTTSVVNGIAQFN